MYKTRDARRLLLTLPALALGLSAAACGGQEGGQRGGQDDGSVRVVASNSIVADLVDNVGGADVEVTTLVGPDEDVHNFEPSPATSRDLAEADVVVENGLQLEPWMEDLYESSGTGAERVQVGEAEDIELLTAEEQEHGHQGSQEDEHSEDEHSEEGGGHGHGEYGPHVWHDPQNAIAMVGEIESALAEAGPGNAGAYEQGAEEYVSELEELDAEVEEIVSGIPEEDRKLVTAHDTFGYYAEAYGFEVVGTSLESFSTEASDPSAGQTAELADEIEQTGVPAIFPENVSNEAVMERIASEADVELAEPLYTDALSGSDGAAPTYAGMVRHNAETMTQALG